MLQLDCIHIRFDVTLVTFYVTLFLLLISCYDECYFLQIINSTCLILQYQLFNQNIRVLEVICQNNGESNILYMLQYRAPIMRFLTHITF